MACFRGSIRSQVLMMDTLINVIVPYDHYDADGMPGRFDKVLYLLHGLKQNADAWQRFSCVERYANAYGYAVVMPEVQRSFYTDMVHGPRYYTYITEELPRVMQAMFRLPDDPARTLVGGLSMGGYGALKCALNQPDRYAGAMCFSSGFDLVTDPERLRLAYYSIEELQGISGQALAARPEDDLYAILDHWPETQKKPLFYLACGSEDYLREKNLAMRGHLTAASFPLQYEEWPGVHDWRFWDAALEKGMRFMAEKLAK